MRIVLVTNWNGIGLETDGRLLEGLLRSWGHETTRAQYEQANDGTYDLAIWLEVFNQHLVPLSSRHWIIPNCEWLKPEMVRPIQRHCEKVLAKTRDAEKSLRSLFANVEYTGFLSEDHYDASFPRVDHVLHCGGNSGFRGTNDLLACYREYRYYDDRSLPELVVISNSKMVDTAPTPGVTFHKRVTDEELKYLQNSCRFHAVPSQYEGFGQVLHEAQGVGAVLLTTGAGPMAEVGAPFEVEATPGKSYNLGTLYEVSIPDLRHTLIEMVSQSYESIAKLSCEARSRFSLGNKSFQDAFRRLLEPRSASAGVSGTVDTPKPRIALLGNLRPEHSTENDLVWSLRDLGYSVTTFQEDEDTTETILRDSIAQRVSLLIYVHTHGWKTPGHMSLDDLWKELQASHIKTCSFHLDLYWGLNQNDGREDRIGTHPFWRTEKVFTADGGHQKEFAERLGADRHEWLPPGVVLRDTGPGEYRKDLAADVGFIGADSYHPEYPFRGRLIEFLRGVYGERFRLYQGYRGRILADVYASTPVFVGDSCFAGSDRYWSDRYPDAIGRGGFLIAPQSKGLTIPMATFDPGNLHQLQDRIDWWLDHPAEREALRQVSWKWVRENETYTNRMTTLLSRMGIK